MTYMWDDFYPDEPIPEPDELRREERYPDEDELVSVETTTDNNWDFHDSWIDD